MRLKKQLEVGYDRKRRRLDRLRRWYCRRFDHNYSESGLTSCDRYGRISWVGGGW
jgi:hypothetical protein